MGCNAVTVNVNGIPYLESKNVQVTTEAVNIAMGFRRIAPVGLFALRIATAIPEGTTGTLPVTLTLNGTARALTQLGGDAVTAADLAGTGVIMVFNDLFNGVLQVVSPLTATA
ncbi:MAG: hypothetical protein IKW84_08835 [Bacteroidaceae bacterium]|nr:hypothetical protein [Bacteroidaceae bacterium]